MKAFAICGTQLKDQDHRRQKWTPFSAVAGNLGTQVREAKSVGTLECGKRAL